jgi:hypothetical protein
MEAAAQQDEQFVKWILGPVAQDFWEFDESGNRIKLKPGWEQAQTEYNRILGLKENPENDLKK